MRTRALLCAVLAAAVVFGCATPPPTTLATIDCPRAQCFLNIGFDNNGKLIADHTKVNLKVPNTVITWTLHNQPGLPQYEFRSRFPDESIAFKGANAQTAQTEFVGRSAVGVTYRMTDRGTNRGMSFDYSVTVYPVSGVGASKFLDPTIFNDF